MTSEKDPLPTVPDHETALTVPDMLALQKSEPPAMLAPEAIVQGMQQLPQHIPEFEQLSVEERRSMARAAHLDPAVIQAGLHLAAMWERTPQVIGRNVEAMRQDDEDTRRWDDAIRTFSATLQGMTSANLKRKHRLGEDILHVYRLVGILMKSPSPETALLRPYYEEMKRVYKQTMTGKPRKGKKEQKPGTPKE
jgi:hypothetical protein